MLGRTTHGGVRTVPSAYMSLIKDFLIRGGVTIVNKEHFTTLYSPAREKAMTKKNILAGRAKTGLFPCHPDRVLRDITKPVADLSIQSVCENRRPCQQEEVVQTPVTPVSSEGLMSLLKLIKQDAHDEMIQARNQRLVQKLANAAQTSFAQQALD